MSGWRTTAAQIARHAASVLVGQLAVIGFGVADTVMTGRHASADLAALSIGVAIYVSVYIGLTGIVQALIPIVGHRHGARDADGVRSAFQQGIWLALFLGLAGFVLLQVPGPLLALTQAEPAVVERARDYLQVLSWALVPALLFRAYSSLSQGLSRPMLVTLLQIAALALKLPLNAWLIDGGAGVPALGVTGCALATLVIQLVLMTLGFVFVLRHPALAPYRLLSHWGPPRWPDQRELLRLGIPGGAAVFFEVTGFTVMALFIARMGTTALAGHQIVASLASVIYMLPLSIAIATAALVAQSLGAQQPAQAHRAARTGIVMAVSCALVFGLLLLIASRVLTGLYTSDTAVQQVARSLLVIVACMQLFDATQVVCSFVLRSYRIALLPAITYGVMLWGVGLAGGWWLAFRAQLAWPSGPAAFWVANTLALALVCAVLLFALQRASAGDDSSDGRSERGSRAGSM